MLHMPHPKYFERNSSLMIFFSWKKDLSAPKEFITSKIISKYTEIFVFVGIFTIAATNKNKIKKITLII